MEEVCTTFILFVVWQHCVYLVALQDPNILPGISVQFLVQISYI